MAKLPVQIVLNPDNRAPRIASVKHEPQCSPPQQPSKPPVAVSAQQSAPPPRVKDEPLDLPLVSVLQPPPPPPQEQQPKDTEAELLNQINQLDSLSSAINAFKNKFDELQKHLDFIKNAIDARSDDLVSQPASRQEQPPNQQTAAAAAPSATETAKTTTKTPMTSEVTPAPAKSELTNLCEAMCGKGLRRYITLRLSNIAKLREEVPPALKCAPNPAKLVLECIGRFFLQGSKAYTKNSPMVTGREACVLVLEFFLLFSDDSTKIEVAVRHEAEQAAMGWRKRLVLEGGIGRASEIDARGLLLLVGCYGIPRSFKDEDVWDLVLSSNSRQISDALRRSRSLVARVSDIIEGKMKNGMKVEAVEVANTFGIEEKFPPQKLLVSVLQESEESLKRIIGANNSPTLLKAAKEKHLAALKSVMKFVEDHNLDPAMLLPGCQVKEKIAKVVKDITDLTKQINDEAIQKRKVDNNGLNNLRSEETKRPRFTEKGSPMVSPGIGLHDQRTTSVLDGKNLYNSSMRVDILGGGYSGRVSNFPSATPIAYESVTGYLPESVLGTLPGGGSAMRSTGVGLQAVYCVSSTSSFAGVQRETIVDRGGQIVGSYGQPFGWHGIGYTVPSEVSGEQSFVRQPVSGLVEQSPSVATFVGVPSSPSIGNRTSAADLYRFADTVL